MPVSLSRLGGNGSKGELALNFCCLFVLLIKHIPFMLAFQHHVGSCGRGEM